MKWVTWDDAYLEEIVGLWNAELRASFPMRAELFKQNSFQDKNVCREASKIVVNDHDEVIGFIIGKRWKEKVEVEMRNDVGWIQALLVHHNYRGLGIGSKLLAHVESVFKQNEMVEILLGRDPWHYFPGIPEQYEEAAHWFEKRGYENFGTEYDMLNQYESTSNVQIPIAKDAAFSILKKEERTAFLTFMNRCFPGRWEYEAMKYFEKGGTGREFVILKKAGKIVGFCRMNDAQSPFIAQNVYWDPLFDDELGGIGPLGVDAAERGNGYGLAIVEAAIGYLRNRGIKQIAIDWTGLIDFYGKLGYKCWKGYKSYKKQFLM